MNCWYSILKYVNNDLSNESLSLGLVMAFDHKVYFKYSERKLDVIKKLNSPNYKLIEFAIKKLSLAFKPHELDGLFWNENQIGIEYIQRLSAYNNGLIQFSPPKRINVIESVEDLVFKRYYNNLIDDIELNNVEQKGSKEKSDFEIGIESNLYGPLKGKVDVDIMITSKQIPSLFFDYHIDAIGVNGALYAVKAIDLSKEVTPKDIKADIAEYETVIDRLNKFAKSQSIAESHCFLIADPSKGTAPSLSDLYSLLEHNQMPYFEVLMPDKIDMVVDLIIRKKAQKLTELL